ncbi:MAG: phosphoribosylformylglycinamidine synthase subunit PurL [Chloroflexi bacterium]|nr:phosphoribosylformylglycinamidine synthase subunit PurL [Chloroflexota bacterium]
MSIDKSLLDEVALSEEEYALIVERLGREPTHVELGMFGSLWSEHCGYKHSKPLLGLLPTTAPHIRVKAGEENAGVVDIGDGLAIVMKMESHNHPSAIEPFQGAATGVGGIVRDIFAMGARPIALLNSLRFGPLTEPHNRYLFGGVVGGIGSYGNCLGIPDVAGEIYFSPAYTQNPLVNAMCVGIVETGKLLKATASGVGNLLMLVGADTGRDGLHGASGLASRTFGDEKELRSAVQVGNPFLEKSLLEACLELAQTDYIVGLQDLGAAGLTSAAVECAGKAGTGIEIDVLRVPRRETGMTPYEVMLSESQERMLVIVKKGYEDKVRALFGRWDLHSDIIGIVTDDGLARIKEGDKAVAEAPVALLTRPPMYRLPGVRPAWLDAEFDLASLPDIAPESAADVLVRLLASPTIASKEWVYRQYDHMVWTNTVIPPGGDGALLRVRGSKKGIALASDGNGRYCYLDPYEGGAIAVAEAARNVVCTGATPLAITDCLNYGNPEKPEVYYQLEEGIRGMAEACRILGTPVISGNVSLYNETAGEPIYPTPVVGMLGLMDDVDRRCTMGFKKEGDLALLLGNLSNHVSSLSGSEYLEMVHNKVAGRPQIDLDLEQGLQRCCLAAIRQGLLSSAHDCSDGGLAVALAECCIAGNIGVKVDSRPGSRLDAFLFGEAQSRIIVSVTPQNRKKLEALASEHGVTMKMLGSVGGDSLALGREFSVPVSRVAQAWKGGLAAALR